MSNPSNGSNSNSTPSEPIKRAVSLTMRTIAKDPELDVVFASDRPTLTGNSARIPEPPRRITHKDISVTRGHGDAVALRRACHDSEIHRKMMPTSEHARNIFDAIEQARCESLGTLRMRGVADNLGAMLEDRYDKPQFQSIERLEDAPVEDALALLVRERLTGLKPPASAKKLVEQWRPIVEEKVNVELDYLLKTLDNQVVFATKVREMLSTLEMAEEYSDASTNDIEEDGDSNQEEQSDTSGDEQDSSSDEQQGPQEQSMSDEQSESDNTDTDNQESEESTEEIVTANLEDFLDNSPNDYPQSNYPPTSDYQIYTSEFDEIMAAEDLCDSEDLNRLRASLDKQISTLQSAVSRLANRLQRRLMAQQNRSWEFDLEEGLLDSARLTRVVTDPMQPLAFKREQDTNFRDTVVTLLLDNSGSMRGRPISVAAITTDILARTLERCGVKVEILGFTTKAWKGGMSREAWVKSGKPKEPGRLNDLRHIIYKSADAPWRRARRNLGLMLKEGLLKENIDGEALEWAYNRLLGRCESRRIMMMISDGAPVDDCTLTNNAGNYLEKHLKHVIEKIETRSQVELIAIGIGHDVTRYYSRAVTIVDAEELAGALTEQLANLFERKDLAPVQRRFHA